MIYSTNIFILAICEIDFDEFPLISSTRRLVLEGHLCSMTKPKDDSKHSLKDPVAAYLASTTSAVIGSSDHVRSIALNDLAVNSKLQVVLPHLVSFFSLQIKHHADKDSGASRKLPQDNEELY